jgi:hypothetical protein
LELRELLEGLPENAACWARVRQIEALQLPDQAGSV